MKIKYIINTPMRILLILSLAAILLSGCDTGNVQPDSQGSIDELATNLVKRGEFAAAADEFLRLAGLHPEQSEIYQLKAADAYIQNTDIDSARSILEKLDLPETASELIFYRNLLDAEVALKLNQPQKALDYSVTITAGMDTGLVIRLYEIRATALASLNELYNAAQELIKIDSLLIENGQEPRYTNRIWNYLVNTDLELLMAPASRNNSLASAWTSLAFISKSLMTRTEELKNAIRSWEEKNPGHPASDVITSQILMISERFNSRPGQIALILPLSGIYERYSERIRDGFLSAWFNEPNYKPGIRIYNAAPENFAAVYQQAVADGAEFIVGPLEKDSVRILAEMETLPVRTLALNQVEGSRVNSASNSIFPLPVLVQFGLPPEDEARQVAQRGILEGYNRALVITSADDFGERVYRAFSEEWTQMGGKILERVDYNPQTSDFVTPIKKLLNIDSSEARISALRQKLGRNLGTNSRLREDIEFIFMVATNLNARQIVPHLRFFRAEAVPIYTISSVYTGKQNPQVDSDLNGIEFVDMPWLVGPGLQGSDIARQIRQSWESSSSIFPRYYAFGVDAFRLISRIGELALKRNYRYEGETGTLYMTTDGVIHRKLLWAKFNEGMPKPLMSEMNP